MAYNSFAFEYDKFNDGADYEVLGLRIIDFFADSGIEDGIIADLGCGTGELSLVLARAGYSVIAIDSSMEMLQVLQEKIDKSFKAPDILLLHQNIEALNLYGSISAAVSTYDTLNHLNWLQVKRAVDRIALFLEPGGMFIFDINTFNKHEKVMANHAFELNAEDGTRCMWHNKFNLADLSTEIKICINRPDGIYFEETFCEYFHKLEDIKALLEACSLSTVAVIDGDKFGALNAKSKRMLIAATKHD